MTDAGPVTRVDDIVVTGQRRPAPSAPFPPRTTGGGGGEQQDEVDDGGQVGGGPVVQDQCADPAARPVWNADAAAAGAVDVFLARAETLGDGPTLGNREFHAYLVRDANGSVTAVNVEHGDPVAGGVVTNVVTNASGVHSGNWMGDVHNHPSGDGRPSSQEWVDFVNQWSSVRATNPERSEVMNAAMYIIVQVPGNPPAYRVYAYTISSNPDELGQEVNPDAQPCP